ncbi:MAG: dihydrofolate reductase [Prevotellaceae bacterium]|jgi:dihydrofolate reductase|nr:dihydrofolate reductase [Prevotellaceae bacterium]
MNTAISIIVAAADNNVIGANNSLLWHIPADLKRFKLLTTGHAVIMGRKTFESIGRPLPNRRNIVVSSTLQSLAGVELAPSLDAAIALAQNGSELFIIGGGSIYHQALPLSQRIYLTRVHVSPVGDTYFPPIDPAAWQLIAHSDTLRCEQSGMTYEFLEYGRKDVAGCE